MAGKFELPLLEDNTSGWGPTQVPEHLKDVPFAPYNKGDRLGRASDWTASSQGRYGRQNQQAGTAVFQFAVGDDEEEYQLVDSNPVQQPKQYKRNPQRNQQFQRPGDQQGDQRGQYSQQRGGRGGGRQQYGNRGGWWNQRGGQVQYTPSIRVDPSWSLVDEVQFASLTKLTLKLNEPQDVYEAGALEYYDKMCERINAQTKARLIPSDRVQPNPTTSDDPIIRSLAQKDVAQVFVTDSILVHLMCAPRSLYSWDIVVTRVGNKLFFDKRGKGNLDRLTVNETAPEPVQEDKDNMNGVEKLAAEATKIQQWFVQQVLDKKRKPRSLKNPSPFKSRANVGYKYRKWQISDELSMVVRCQIDGIMTYQDQDQLISIKAFNEYGPNSEWKNKLEEFRGALLAIELKNNSFKVAKWTAQALLSGVDQIKLGYVSRRTSKDNQNHAILGTQTMKPSNFAQQMNLKMDNCWGIVRAIVDLCISLPDGKYLLLKEPSKPVMKFYQVPEDAFTEEE
eukprot:TRINITY_DN1224_c0_g1_i1.p1 TRINITY_DN1224_c0_g1~~TRINITY_DN1224_c0_g1_i1.p1  ORF type:complete len:518 (-),score=61.61 TRINITY_DN1224_c0_g1_i1:413-1933(-)